MRLVVLMVLVACSRSERKPPEVEVVVAPGTVRGTATSAVIPGVEPPPGTPMRASPSTEPCDIVATSKAGVATTVRSNAKGEFELQLAAGGYALSFAACTRSCNATPVDPMRKVVVKSGEISSVQFHCEGAAP